LLQPLVELLYRGVAWHHRNGNDWTIEAFLVSEAPAGVGLDIAQDRATRDAMLRTVPVLMQAPLARLRGRRLTAADFDTLHLPDPIVTLLDWLDGGDAVRSALAPEVWESFRSRCRDGFDCDPERDNPASLVARLTDPSHVWDAVWQRFVVAPPRYMGIVAHLQALGRGDATMFADPARFPARNDQDEAAVRAALASVPTLSLTEARKRVRDLEVEHGRRRTWPWAGMGRATMAAVLAPLHALVEATAAVGADAMSAAQMASWYATAGYRADLAALEAMRVSPAADRAVVGAAVRALYLPWVEPVATAFQGHVGANPKATLVPSDTPAPTEGQCLLFVDGLRYDVATLVRDELVATGNAVTVTHRMAPYPTVTATAKPMAAGLSADLGESAVGDGFMPRLQATSQEATSPRLHALFAARGIEVLTEVWAPSKAEARGWLETGTIDKRGHEGGVDLVVHLEAEVAHAVQVIGELLTAGWRSVRVVTDHGWLLMPGGLPHVAVPKVVVSEKWARSALPEEGAVIEAPQAMVVPWHWNPLVGIATPKGAGSFLPNVAYAHGGLSPQECVVPDLVVTTVSGAGRVTIDELVWHRLSCRVTVSAGGQTAFVQLRKVWRDASTMIGESSRPVGATGLVRIPVSDEHEGQAATVVVIDGEGNVLARAATTVGGD
jgi:hypothetical protein